MNSGLLDADDLFRGLPPGGPHYHIDGSEIVVKETAFNDRDKKPSVDLVRKCPNGQPRAELHPEEGILILSVGKVRSCSGITITGKDNKSKIIYAFDVWPHPKYDNPAHCQIESSPEFASSDHFKRLKIALARSAARWFCLPPTNS